MTDEVFYQDVYCQQCTALVVGIDDHGIRLDRTVFYPSGGGQPGDTGLVQLANGKMVTITDTQKDFHGEIVHIPGPHAERLQVGDKVTAQIDWQRRYRHMRMHTCLHLLCAVVKAGVTGGSIGAERGRLDFDLAQPVDKQTINDELNRLIQQDLPVQVKWITDSELEAQPDLVKTLSVQPPKGQGQVRLLEIAGIDLQPCGGTHVARTGEIGPVKITKIEKKSRHNRRINVTFTEQTQG